MVLKFRVQGIEFRVWDEGLGLGFHGLGFGQFTCAAVSAPVQLPYGIPEQSLGRLTVNSHSGLGLRA